MSRTVDDRVVEMSFDNREFERNVSTSMSTVDKLKKSLDFSGTTQSLENVDKASRGINFEGLGSAIDTVKARFSAFEVMAVTALANITNSAINAGKQLVSSLTIAPVKEGFDEYELKMGSVQTIMASTGESLDTVMGYLNELNIYADRTIYSFADMTQNIGKFTNAGVSLDKAVAAIQGVSNVAAVSGANANEASRAMYNFAQALSAGYVKLIDWKSIENANMATVEFKTQLLESAVAAGTLEKTSDGMYRVLSKNANGGTMAQAISATQNFNDSLSYQWMTTEVLTGTLAKYSDETTEIGKKAFAAAQDVKTFSQLIDTLKEAVGSGWAETWELIFGNFDEAKKLWTSVNDVVGEFINKTSEARNTFLQSWKIMGGRDNLIAAIGNAFKDLKAIIAPIKEAFRDIFPKMLPQTLANFTARLRAMTAQFKLSDDTAQKIKNTFKGLFAAFDIVKRVVSALFTILKPFGKILLSIGGAVLSVTSKIGEWIVKLRDAIKQNDRLVNFAKTVADIFETIREKVTNAINKVLDAIKAFNGADISGTMSWTERIKKRFEAMEPFLEGVKNFFLGIWEALKKLAPIFSSIGKFLGSVLTSLGDGIKNVFQNANFSSLSSLAGGGALTAIALFITNFFKNLSKASGNFKDAFKNLNESFKGIKEVFDGVRGCLEAYQKNLNAKTLLTIAGAILILTVSVIALSRVDPDKLSAAVMILGAEFLELGIAMNKLMKSLDGKKMKGAGKVALLMIGLSIAVLILSNACRKLADIPYDSFIQGLAGVGVLMMFLVKSAESLSKSTGKIGKSALGLILLAVAIRLLVKPVKELGEMEWSALGKGLLGLLGILGSLAAFLKLAKLDSIGIKSGIGLVLLAASIKMLVKPIKELSTLSWEELGKGLGGLAGMLLALGLAIRLGGFEKMGVLSGVGLILLATSIRMLVDPIKELGGLSLENLAKGVGAIAVALGAITIALNFMPKNMVFIGVGLLLVAEALKVVTKVMTTVAEMNWADIGKGLLVVAGALAAMTLALNFSKGTLGGAVSLLILSNSLLVLAGVLKILATMSPEQLTISLIALAGGLAAIVIAGFGATAVAPGLLALGAAVVMIGVGALAAGAGILMLASGLSILAVAGSGAVSILLTTISGLIAMIPEFIASLGKGFVRLIETFGEASSTIVDAVSKILIALSEAFGIAIPSFVESILALIEGVLGAIVEHGPAIVESLLQMLITILDGIRNNVGTLITIILDTVTEIIVAVIEYIPTFADKLAKAMINLFEGLALSIEENAPKLRESFLHLCKALLDAFLGFFGIHSPSTVFLEKGKYLIQGLINGIGSKIRDVVDKVKDLGRQMLDNIKEKWESFKNIGKNLIDGLKDGIASKFQEVKEAATRVVKGAVNAVKNFLGIHSPSKLFYSLGQFSGQGYINALDDSVKKTERSGANLGQAAINGMKNAISRIAAAIDSDIEYHPTITPVLDLSNVTKGASSISALLNREQALGLSANFGSTHTEGQNGTSSSTYSFVQNNYSPKALSRIDIYRQTKNQFSTFERMATT